MVVSAAKQRVMKIFLLCRVLCAIVCVFAYRDGARENSCYDHSIVHGPGTEVFQCDPPSCSFFLRIREVVDETTLELGNETNAYQCGRVYGSKLILSSYNITLLSLNDWYSLSHGYILFDTTVIFYSSLKLKVSTAIHRYLGGGENGIHSCLRVVQLQTFSFFVYNDAVDS